MSEATPEDIKALDKLKNRHHGARAAIFGNGWRLNMVKGLTVRDDVISIGTNRSIEVIDSMYHCSIDKSCEAPESYRGVRFGAMRPDNRDERTIGAFWSDYWARHGMIVKSTSPPYVGLYAIEVAVFLGCSQIMLIAFDGDDRPGTSS